MDEMDTLIRRIAGGMTTADDAATVRRQQARLAAYEQALRWIALYGHGDAAMLACRVLAGEDVSCETTAEKP